MKLIKHILAATDLSGPSLQAVDRGFELAKSTSARYTVMHALGLDALGPLRNLLGSQADSVAHKVVENQLAALQRVVDDPAMNRGISARVLVEEGLAATVVPAYAGSADADLVVVGSRGQGTLRRLLIGSTASHLLRKSRVPVLIVKAPGRGPYGRVLVPVDFSPAGELAIRMAREVAPDAFVVLLNVFDVPFESMLQYAGVSQDDIHRYRIEARQRSVQQLHALAARAGLDHGQYTMLVEHGDATRVIVDQAERSDCELIVMGKHGTHVSEELLLGSVTKRVLDESDVDMLVVVDKRRPDSTVP